MSSSWTPQSGGSSPTLFEFQAIWDTGATHSAITPKVIDTCGLSITGRRNVSNVNETTVSPTYLVNITLLNSLQVHDVVVTKGQLPNSDADVLIGMDIINLGDFAVTNYEGLTAFSFRYPSIEKVDFTIQTRPKQRKPKQWKTKR